MSTLKKKKTKASTKHSRVKQIKKGDFSKNARKKFKAGSKTWEGHFS